ncbi:DNA repair protein RadA [Candidatus Uhrbacteria bacterium CG_4_10_14_0_8_um_filter_58_22]|uniref:DNA repair protein RadA n=1 Tax=Candidatus Uhrbacteria bacterium CG_4_10_14_0_8_um_filter_58_22 TaxID=1975029 RepID=A0A2M7QBF1_9BACT|nr:MAG: DNA repair protein RadA [Parcubacteria group bacterium CG1_02_58_44]PIY63162.1 MAG: DNA repair protein RadA [Candidatus Uhrbacteria bacterium CG_4_10_14_0_8_um_filter_58_22]
MKTATTIYTCTKCDAQSPKWTGQCLECGAWGTVAIGATSTSGSGSGSSVRLPGQASKRPGVPPAKPERFGDIRTEDSARSPIGIGELDRVFGGGIVPGSVTLVGGEPGIGKSTICLQIAAHVSTRGKVVYASGEESAAQIKSRAGRIGDSADEILFLGETEVETIVATLDHERPALAVIDSVQMLRSSEIPAEAGAVSTIRGATAKLVEFAKRTGVPLILVGHVTKDGNVAGPKTLEHLVDAVLSFEGERTGQLRILRVLKNRFGSTDETGIFEMTGEGLKEITNPSAYMLEERNGGTPGDVISCVLEGTRPVLVDIQALVQPTSFGYPTRRATGFDQSRLEMLIAVLAARGGLDLGQHDVFVNVVGGLKIKDPSVDLAVLLALASAHGNRPLGDLAVWGEVGLGGEIRPVPATDRRLSEAARLGIRTAVAPLPRNKTSVRLKGDIEIRDVHTIAEALAAVTKAKA